MINAQQLVKTFKSSRGAVIFFLVLEIEPRASYMLGKCSATELHLQPQKSFRILLLEDAFCLIVPSWKVIFIFFLVLGFAKQALYHLSHVSSLNFFLQLFYNHLSMFLSCI
jgi:hypothetical protein